MNFLLTGGGTGTTWRNQVAELSRDKVLPNFEGIIGLVPRLTGELRHHFFFFSFFSLLEPRRGAILKEYWKEVSDEEEVEAEM